ncbi:hypothetical protein H6G80_03140 [Nostoc sp. FACHB-87]|uniref:hypothetical protein n=1 Tax=Nostocaceae TaxID=1162 RepID=UPI0016859E12|nr:MULTISPECIES: hypothetical protein [Nostocaceae]MBD2416067.1 hypothetical protein [Nostoc calcicola FACHB-3891]MBD2453069.1 hypothetical protein [Nostoc sp. FACHB-87]MBD2475153.1 hypothetical protein [Anabaena sp. FACHB-83]
MALFNPSQVTVTIPSSSSAVPTTVNASASSQSLLAANSNRRGATIWNNSTANLYIELGSTASLTAFTAKLLPGGYYETPFNYIGAISGIWDAVNGNAQIRELT